MNRLHIVKCKKHICIHFYTLIYMLYGRFMVTIRKLSVFIFTFAIVAFVVGLIGCEKAMEMVPDEQMPEGITIGVAVALTGNNAEPYGLPMKRGLELAQEELNMNGADIRLDFEDPLSTVDGAKAAVQALVDKGVPAIIGIGISTHLKQAFPIAQEAGVVAFSPISSAAGLSGEIGDYVFRAGIATNVLIPGGVEKTLATLNYVNVAVIYDAADTYSTSIKDELSKALAAKNVTVQTTESFQTGATDFNMQLTAIMNMKPDALFIAALSKEMIQIITQANEIGITARLIIPVLTDNEVSAAGDAAEGAIGFARWSSRSETPGNQAFVAAYMAKYSRAPEPFASQAYATLHILANAINTAQSTDSTAIRDALAQTMSFPTILGPFSFDPNGEAIYENIDVIIQEVVGGTLQDQ